MRIATFIQALNEKARPAPNWASPKGIYGDYSKYPEIEFYCKCPKCGETHGTYKTFQDAHSRRLCQRCNREAVDKYKKQIRDLDSYKNRGKPYKGNSRVFNEADELLPGTPPESPEPPPTRASFNPTKYLLSAPRYTGWIGDAIASLNTREDSTFTLKDEDLDVEFPDKIEKFEVVGSEPGEFGHATEYLIWKTEDLARAEAVDHVRDMLEAEPETFTQDWLEHYINMDRLKRDLNDQARDVEWLRDYDEEEQLEYLIEHDYLEQEDFYFSTGRLRKITPSRQRLIDTAIETVADKQESDFDPMEWLRDIYGKDEAAKEAIKIAGIDRDAAAEAAVQEDGWAHFANGYSEDYLELDGDAVAIRTQ